MVDRHPQADLGAGEVGDWDRRFQSIAGALKRGRGQVRGESAYINGAGTSTTPNGLSQIAGRECTPEFAAQASDQLSHLLASLPDETLRAVALGKLAGHTNAEISDKLGLSLRAVERKLSLIRREWEAEVPQ